MLICLAPLCASSVRFCFLTKHYVMLCLLWNLSCAVGGYRGWCDTCCTAGFTIAPECSKGNWEDTLQGLQYSPLELHSLVKSHTQFFKPKTALGRWIPTGIGARQTPQWKALFCGQLAEFIFPSWVLGRRLYLWTNTVSALPEWLHHSKYVRFNNLQDNSANYFPPILLFLLRKCNFSTLKY